MKCYDVTFAKCSRVLADLAGGHADGSWEARIRRWVRPRVLILDDFAMRSMTAGQADAFYELICERRKGSVILTSNRAPSDWYGLSRSGGSRRALDRLINSAHHVLMEGRSFRTNKRPGRSQDQQINSNSND